MKILFTFVIHFSQNIRKLYNKKYIVFLSLIAILSCTFNTTNKKNELFTLLDKQATGINFENNVPYTEDYNTYTYKNFYNGGGVALGDINNDGLLDVYLTGNITDNKLFLNKGNWKFEDITIQAGVQCSNVWSTGATFVDINGDGWQDLYVCKAGKPGGANRHNELFINQKNGTFLDKSKEYGLDIVGLSIHSSFFDYDADGDLDCYILCNSLRSVGGFDLNEGIRNTPDPEGNKLMRNDNGKFVDVSTSAGIYTSKIGYGLGITVSDFNNDYYPDIFISNDFFEKDYLYFNKGNGTFVEESNQAFGSMSMGSMGADACDIDNDLKSDLFVTEMLPKELERKLTKNQYDNWDKHKDAFEKGYHHQFSRNMLQKNLGNNRFLEIGRLSGVEATEWSWASIVQDFDNDGLKDLFVSNGLYKDLLDKDYLSFSADRNMISSKIQENAKVITMLIDSMPSSPVINSMFRNMGDYHFENVSDRWGLGQESYSNGSAYGDLDNDGDLDLIVNNVNMPSFVYKNTTDTSVNHSLTIQLQGYAKNTNAIGAKVIVKSNQGYQMLENFTSKGFQSSIDPRLHFGMGKAAVLDSLWIIWPDKKVSVYNNLKTNKLYRFVQRDANFGLNILPRVQESFGKCRNGDFELNFSHQDIDINLFANERLLLEMSGFKGPAIAVADVNGDRIEDVFCGGGRNQESVLFVSHGTRGNYLPMHYFKEELNHEAQDAVFADFDGDGDQDLYIAHGGKSFSEFSDVLNDMIYVNDGKGSFSWKKDALQWETLINTSCIKIADLNGDKLLDVIIGEGEKNALFGLSGSVYVAYNKGDCKFDIVSPKSLQNIGMITDIEIGNFDGNQSQDVAITMLWKPVKIVYDFHKSKDNPEILNLKKTSGLWRSMVVADINQDGLDDIICGNEGINNFYKKARHMFINDFDGNGMQEQLVCEENQNKKYFAVHDVDEVFSQLPIIKKRFLHYKDYVRADLETIFGKEKLDQAMHLELDKLQSTIFMNEGSRNFKTVDLPIMLQASSINSMLLTNNEGKFDLILGGNNHHYKPQWGNQDASYGWRLSFSYKGGKLNYKTPESLHIKGDIRNIKKVENNIIFGVNNDKVIVCKN